MSNEAERRIDSINIEKSISLKKGVTWFKEVYVITFSRIQSSKSILLFYINEIDFKIRNFLSCMIDVQAITYVYPNAQQFYLAI